MKKILLTTFIIFFALNSDAQMISKHGIIANGGFGTISKDLNPLQDVLHSDVSYKSSYAIGYRFRLEPNINPFFIDLDASLGMKLWESSYSPSLAVPPLFKASSQYYFVSVGGTFNYSIYRGLSVGLGVEPTSYFYQDGEKSNNKFDTPLIGKVAYDFKILEVGVSYKYGLTDVIKTDRIKSGKFQDIQLSVFIPF